MVEPIRVFISYANESPGHEDAVRELWLFLRSNGFDARLDLPVAERRVDWPLWMHHEVRDADFVLVIASPAYKRRAEGDAGLDEGRGVQWEAALIREEFYTDRDKGLAKFVPVVLPGQSAAAGIPTWLGPSTSTYYPVPEFTVTGAERLIRYLSGQWFEVESPIGTLPVLAPLHTGGTPVSPSVVDVPGHVFISYVREDSQAVDQLEKDLTGAGIQVWRDVRDIWPGDDWKREIRRAIEHDSCAFIACFSRSTRARETTYQWEELTLAATSFRLRPPGKSWIYPVRFDEGPIIDFDLGAGRNLTDLHYADLFGPQRAHNAERLIAGIRRSLGPRIRGRE